MKTFKSFLNESRAEDRNQFHIIVIGNEAEIEPIDEGKWLHSGIMDYWKRVEKSNTTHVQVHIGRLKHVHTKSSRITWHVNGVKHDKKSFNDNSNGLSTAVNITKAILKLPDNKTLETIANENASSVLAAIDYLPNKAKIFVFKIVDTE